ncbi:hypothetical protein KO495_01375 [Colwellia sp. D2M02]|nr:hypothetical protein [Colwellia sp. D2M02]
MAYSIKRIFCSYLILLLFSPLFFVGSALAKGDNILIYIRDDVYIDYQKFVVDKNVMSIESFASKHIRRDVVDMIIAQQALILGGFSHQFHYATGKVNFRNTKMLQNGELLISFDTYWLADAKAIEDKVYISDAVIRNGEYIAGMYTSINNHKALAVKSINDLKDLTAVSTPLWRTDWQTIQSLPLKKVTREDSWLSMARMVNLQWIDFLLMPFNSTPDQSFTIDKIHLVPVKNIGVLLKDSRNFVISKKHPKGEEAFIAINKGLKILRQRGAIRKAYIDAGFIIENDNLTIINP